MSKYDVLNKAKTLWAEVVALQVKIEMDEPEKVTSRARSHG